MASSSFLQHIAIASALLVVLYGCSTDGVTPPRGVGKTGVRHASARPPAQGRQLLGRVGDPAAEARIAADENVETPDYLNTPNLAGYGHTGQKRLPKIDEEPAGEDSGIAMRSLAAEDDGMQAAGQMPIPPGGVNMDGGLGIGEPGQTGNRRLAAAPQPPIPPSQMAIPEGQSAEPVVDGIGTDNPALLTPQAGFNMPDPMVTGTASKRLIKRKHK